ncbi:MAG: methyl-accepting chemotaxis sensory transducer, partial [Betaproteobacteria bacterium]|nr:methyl-accepting chemotaxis sensory transducer [Betaproteobacteria bacterium]
MFSNISIKTRLVSVIALLSVLMLVVGGLGLFGMQRSNDGLKTVYEDRTVPLQQLAAIDRLLNVSRLQVASAIIDGRPEVAKQNAVKIQANTETINKLWASYVATYLTPAEKKLSDKLADDRAKMAREAQEPMVAALRDGNVEAAKAIYQGRALELNAPVRAGIEALIQLQLDVAKEEYEGAVTRYSTLRATAGAMIALALLMGAVLGFFLVRAIVRPMQQAVALANAVAAGDLTSTIATDSTNEFGQLLKALERMNENLASLVGKVRTGVDSISTGSQQIASGNADLSQRTEEQASSLEETASSMEELASTVKQNAENAKQANALAASASEVAVKGGRVVGEVVQTMSSINDASKKIADIISVIDGIAFQTNILALNAAVEAARAGEQGRGFAVVASEVRTLAQRSAGAAKEIKELISDSVNKVEAGTRLVDDAGKTMGEVVASVQRVTGIMAEITAAAHEQSAGIEQVNQAVMQMDQVTQQNAAL